eukprot:366197-Chlamydomonas_euryale.AAC.20
MAAAEGAAREARGAPSPCRLPRKLPASRFRAGTIQPPTWASASYASYAASASYGSNAEASASKPYRGRLNAGRRVGTFRSGQARVQRDERRGAGAQAGIVSLRECSKSGCSRPCAAHACVASAHVGGGNTRLTCERTRPCLPYLRPRLGGPS